MKSHTAGLRACRNAEVGNFWYEFAQKGYIPLSDFSKIWHGGGSSRFAPSRQILPFWLSKCGLTYQKQSPKMLICGIHFPQRGIFPSAIFTKFCLGEGAPRPHYSTKFQRCSYKTVAVRHQKSPIFFGKCLPLGKNSGGR